MGINGNVTCGNHSDGNCQKFPFKLRLNKQIKEDHKNVMYVNYFWIKKKQGGGHFCAWTSRRILK